MVQDGAGRQMFHAFCYSNGSCAKLSAWETASFPSSLYNLRTPEIGTHWKIPLTVRPGKSLSKETLLGKFQFAGSSSYLCLAVREYPRENNNLRKVAKVSFGCRDVRWLVALCPWSGNTESGMLVLSVLSHLYAQRRMLPTSRVDNPPQLILM